MIFLFRLKILIVNLKFLIFEKIYGVRSIIEITLQKHVNRHDEAINPRVVRTNLLEVLKVTIDGSRIKLVNTPYKLVLLQIIITGLPHNKTH